MLIALIALGVVAAILMFFVYNLLKGIDERDTRIAKRDERLQEFQSEIYSLRDAVDAWQGRYEDLKYRHDEINDLEEGEDYVRASLGLTSDDEEEIEFIRSVLRDHEWEYGDSFCKCTTYLDHQNYQQHLAERISTALNARIKD